MSTLAQQYETAQAAADKFAASDISDAAIGARRAAAVAFAAAYPGEPYQPASADAGSIAAQASALAETMLAERLPAAVQAALPAAVAEHLAANPPPPAASLAVAAPSLADTTVLGFPLADLVSFLGMLAGAIVPGAQLAGLTVSQITALAVGVANEVPAAIQAVEEIAALAKSGAEPTAEQWASWNAAADAANAAASAAEDEVLQGAGP